MSQSIKPTVFISFNSKSSDFVDSLEGRLSKEATVLRYEDEIPSWGSFRSFMDSIKDQDFAVLVISDAYMKSYACMYEVVQAMKSANWKDKVMIALMADAKPYADDERIKYIKYWTEQYGRFCDELKGLPLEVSKRLEEKRDIIKQIRDSIDEFLDFISDSNCPQIYNVIQEICDRVKISTKSVFTYINGNGKTINSRLLWVLKYIEANPAASVSMIAEGIGISRQSVLHCVRQLIDQGKIIVISQGRKSVYSVA